MSVSWQPSKSGRAAPGLSLFVALALLVSLSGGPFLHWLAAPHGLPGAVACASEADTAGGPQLHDPHQGHREDPCPTCEQILRLRQVLLGLREIPIPLLREVGSLARARSSVSSSLPLLALGPPRAPPIS